MDILVCLGFIFCYNAKNVNFLSTIIYLLFTSNENEQIVLVFFHCLKDVREGGGSPWWSISSTLNVRIFLYERTFWQLLLCTCNQKKLPKWLFVRKMREVYVDEIDTWWSLVKHSYDDGLSRVEVKKEAIHCCLNVERIFEDFWLP